MKVDSTKFLSVAVLLLISTLGVNGGTSTEPAIVKDVSFDNHGDFLEARITATGESRYSYFELSEPHRLVVDFHGIQNTIRFREKRVDAGGVERVRTSLFSDTTRTTTRIVFDLNKDAPFRLIDDGGGIVRIVFGQTARAPRNQTAGPAIAMEPGNYPSASATRALKLAAVWVMPE